MELVPRTLEGYSGDSTITSQITDDLVEARSLLSAISNDSGKLALTLQCLRKIASYERTSQTDTTVITTDVPPRSSNSNGDTVPFRFLDLPSEIRNMVYQECLVVGDAYTVNAGHTEKCRSRRGFSRPQLQLFYINHQVLREAGTIFFSENRFRFGFRQDTFPWRKPGIKWRAFDDILKPSRRPHGLLSNLAQDHMKSVVIAMDMRDYQKMEDDRRVNESKRIRASFAEPEPTWSPTSGQRVNCVSWSRFGTPSLAWTRFHRALRCMRLDRLEISLEQCYCTQGFRYQLDDHDVLETIIHWQSAYPKLVTITDCYTVDERERMRGRLRGLSVKVTVQGPSWDPDLEPSVGWY